MNTTELKQMIKLKIDAINNPKLLEALNNFIENEGQNLIFLSDEQRNQIIKAQKDYAEGRFEDNNVVNEEILKWLREE